MVLPAQSEACESGPAPISREPLVVRMPSVPVTLDPQTDTASAPSAETGPVICPFDTASAPPGRTVTGPVWLPPEPMQTDCPAATVSGPREAVVMQGRLNPTVTWAGWPVALAAWSASGAYEAPIGWRPGRNLKGNAAGWVSLSVKDVTDSREGGEGEWREVLPRTRLEPDSPHRLPLAAPVLATHARLDVYPDGGLARLRLHGGLTDAGAAALTARAARATGTAG